MPRPLITFALYAIVGIAPLSAGFAQEPATPAIPDGVVIQRNVAYLSAGRSEKADLYLPAKRDAAVRSPAVVIIHGGGWSGGRGRGGELNIGTTLALNGYVGLSIDYLLATDQSPSWPQNIHDCKSAVRWLRANAERLQIDADHIGAIGGSAGGHLAALLATSGNVHELDPSGPYGEFSCADSVRGPHVWRCRSSRRCERLADARQIEGGSP